MTFSIHPESPNKQAIPLIEEVFREVEPRLRELLPELTNDLQLYVYDENIIPETGTGGLAYSPTILSLAIDNDFTDKKRQRESLVGLIFHESYHLVQGHTVNDGHATYTSALDSAVYEGCATVFEREYTDETPLYGDHSMHAESELESWRDSLSKISIDDWLKDNSKLWQQWSFYDAKDSQRWKSYKVGTWIVETYLDKTGKDIRDLRLMSANEITTQTR